MGLRIRTNIASIKSQRQLAASTKAVEDRSEQLASGYRINKSADDAAGLAISEKMRGHIRSLSQAKRNAADGVSMIQVAEGTMSEVSTILIRLRELAVQSASDTVGATERGFANKEYVALVDEIDRLAKTTEFGGVKLLSGSESNDGMSELTIHVGINDGSVPNTDTIELNIEALRIFAEEDLGLGNQEEIGPLLNGASDNVISFSRESAAQKLGVIDLAMTRIAGQRAELGAKENRLNVTMSNLAVQEENMSSAKSRIKDVDFAKATAEMTQANILSQAGISVLSQANGFPEIALSLLR